MLTNVMNRADVGVVQGRGCFRLALETAQGLCVFGYFIGQELQSHETV